MSFFLQSLSPMQADVMKQLQNGESPTCKIPPVGGFLFGI
jgi:hypothetical protein